MIIGAVRRALSSLLQSVICRGSASTLSSCLLGLQPVNKTRASVSTWPALCGERPLPCYGPNVHIRSLYTPTGTRVCAEQGLVACDTRGVAAFWSGGDFRSAGKGDIHASHIFSTTAIATLHPRFLESRPSSHGMGLDEPGDFSSAKKTNQPADEEKGSAPQVSIKDQQLVQVAILGVPNAGKSTLANALVGQKVSAVSPKTNTTSIATLGAFVEGRTQVIIYDTPGLVTTRYIRSGLHQERVQSAWGIAAECDLLLLIVDAERQLHTPDPRVLTLVKNISSKLEQCPPSVLLLNKIDKIQVAERSRLPSLIHELTALHQFDEVFLISAAKQKGLSDLRHFLVSRAKAGEWLLDPSKKTDMSDEDRAREVVREQVFMRMYKEVPYKVQLKLEDWKTLSDGSLRVEFILLAPNEQVRRMLVGKKGAVIGEVGIKARKELQELFGRTVHLILTVKTL